MQDVDLPVDFAFEKLDVSHVGGKLIEYGVEGDPCAEPDLGPGVVVERAAQINDTDDGLGGDARRARQGVEQHGVFVAVAFFSAQHFERIGDTHGRLFGDFPVYPVFDF